MKKSVTSNGPYDVITRTMCYRGGERGTRSERELKHVALMNEASSMSKFFSKGAKRKFSQNSNVPYSSGPDTSL